MAKNIQVDVGIVRKTATEMNRINQTIFKEFEAVESHVKTLNSTWDSPAADLIINKFYQIKSYFYEPRKKELDNYVQLLNKQIGDGYEVTEKANKDLSELFL